jgi:LysR family transcriptional regulator of gallate degradation
MPFLVSLRHLRAFIAVAEQGSVTKAAESLFRAQSAVTRSIRELELALDVELFERKTSGMLCTVFGNVVLERAQRAVHEFELAADELLDKPKTNSRITKPRFVAALFNERRLLTFVKLVESRHMPTVAKSLGISQPAVSGSINDLEASLGFELFKRTSKGMVTTEDGELLTFRVKRALAELRHVEEDIAALRGTMEGRVIVGALPLGRTFILPDAINRVLAKHPHLRFSTVEGPFDHLAAGLRAGDIDFIFGALRPPDYAKDLIGEPLLSDRMSVVGRRDHPLAKQKKIGMDDLLKAQWVLSNRGTPARHLFDLSFTAENLEPPVDAVETSDLAILRGLLMHSDMLTAISAQQLHYEIAAGALQVLNIDLPKTTRMIGITQRMESLASPGALALMEEIRNVIQEIQGNARAA